MYILTCEEFHADLKNATKCGVLKSTQNGETVIETVYQNLYTGNLWVQVETIHSDGTVSARYEEYGTYNEIQPFAERLWQQKQDSK